MEEDIWKVYIIKEWTSVMFGLTTVKHKTIWEVSNFGRVKRNGKLITKFNEEKYYRIGGFRIHRAVAELFVPNPNNYNEVDHIDGNSHNNRADNLRWVNHDENMNNPVTTKNCSEAIRNKWNEEEYRNKQIALMNDIEYNAKRSEQQKEFWQSEKAINSKNAISLKNSGKNNGMYGKNTHCWVTNGNENHLIKVEDLEKYISLGYKRGQSRNII